MVTRAQRKKCTKDTKMNLLPFYTRTLYDHDGTIALNLIMLCITIVTFLFSGTLMGAQSHNLTRHYANIRHCRQQRQTFRSTVLDRIRVIQSRKEAPEIMALATHFTRCYVTQQLLSLN